MSASAVKAVDGLIIPEKIPGDDLWPGDVGSVADGLVASAKALRSGADDVTTGWAGLPAVFVAPDAAVVYGAVAPASESAHAFAKKVDVIAAALHHYAEGLGSLKRTFAAIKADAVTFRAKVGSDGRVWMSPQHTKKYEWDSKAQFGRSQFAAGSAQDVVDYLRSRGETARLHYGAPQLRASWTESGDLIDQNNRLLDRVADAYASLSTLEAECANKINTQRDDCVAEVVAVQGWQLKQGGDQTADLPWGHRVNEDRNCGESFWWGAGNAGLTMVQGLGSLISYNPTTNGWGDWDNAGKAWVAAGTGIGSLLLSTMPITPILAAAGVPLFQDAQTKTQDMFKGLVAWDTWAKNPSEAAGAVLVNVGTFFIPGAGEVGGVIKALTVGTKLEIVASAITKVEAVTSKVTAVIPDALGDLLTKLKTDKIDVNVDVHVEIPTDIHATIGAHPDAPTVHASGGDHAPDGPSLGDAGGPGPKIDVPDASAPPVHGPETHAPDVPPVESHVDHGGVGDGQSLHHGGDAAEGGRTDQVQINQNEAPRPETPHDPNPEPAAWPGISPQQTEFASAEMTTDAGSAFFGPWDGAYPYTGDVPLYPGEYALDVHGAQDSVAVLDSSGEWQSLDAHDFADVVRNSTEWDGATPIRLFSCDTGAAADGFAQQLADELKVPVTAPDQLVWSVSGGHEPIVSSMHEYAVSTETGARLPVGSEKFLHEDEYEWRQEPTYPPDGGWHTFTPGTH